MRQAFLCTSRTPVPETPLSMAIQPFKKNSKQFRYKDAFFEIVFVGNGEEPTQAEIEAWVDAYSKEAANESPDPLIVDYDIEREVK
jgi:hypothetical protein